MRDIHYQGMPSNATSHKTGANFALATHDGTILRLRFSHGSAGSWHMALLLTAIEKGSKIDIYVEPGSTAADDTLLMNTISIAE